MQKIIDQFHEYITLLKTPLGYRPWNIGQFGGFLEKHGTEIFEALNLVEASRMSFDIERQGYKGVIDSLAQIAESREKEIQKLKNEIGNLKKGKK